MKVLSFVGGELIAEQCKDIEDLTKKLCRTVLDQFYLKLAKKHSLIGKICFVGAYYIFIVTSDLAPIII